MNYNNCDRYSIKRIMGFINKADGVPQFDDITMVVLTVKE